jgi:hypothetical protein
MNHPAAAAAPSSTAPEVFTLSIPRIGAPLGGGTFVGVLFNDDGAPDYLLINGPIASKARNWNDQMKWAASLDHDGPHDWTLPNRTDLRVQICNAQKEFDNGWFWSSEPYAGFASSAWCQYFNDGRQDANYKYGKLLGRAVRKLPIR